MIGCHHDMHLEFCHRRRIQKRPRNPWVVVLVITHQKGDRLVYRVVAYVTSVK